MSKSIFEQGVQQSKQGNYKKAIECFDRVIEDDISYKSVFTNKGIALRNLRQYNEAIECFDIALEQDEKDKDAYNNKGLSLYELGKFQEALEIYNKSIEVYKLDKFTYNYKGNVLQRFGRYQEAVECYNIAIELDNKYVKAYNNKGVALKNLGRYSEAYQCYDLAIKLDPKFIDSYINKGLVYQNQGNFQQAIANYNKVIELDPTNKEAFNNKAFALRKLGQHQEALDCFNKAINIDPHYVLPYANKANTHYQLGQHKEAVESIKQAEKLLDEGHTQQLSFMNIKFIKDTIKQLLEIQRAGKQILQKTNSISGNKEEKERLEKVATKFIGLLQHKAIKNTVKYVEKITYNNSKQGNQNQQVINDNGNADISHIIQDINQQLNEKEQSAAEWVKILEAKYEALVDRVSAQEEKVSNQEIKVIHQEQQLFSLEKKQIIVDSQIEQINSDLENGGVKERAHLQRELNVLRSEGKEVFNYYKTFYWSALNMFQTYRVISSGLFQVNYQETSTQILDSNQDTIKDGLKFGLAVGMDICKEVIKSVPIVGNIFRALDGIVGVILGASKSIIDKKDQVTFQNKVNSINKIIQLKFGSEEEISIKLAKTALMLAKLRKNSIKYPEPSEEKTTLSEWLQANLLKIEDAVFDKEELNDKSSNGVQLALRDVTLLISYLCQYSSQICALEDDISSILVELVEQKRTEQLLKQQFAEFTEKDQSSSCCTIF